MNRADTKQCEERCIDHTAAALAVLTTVEEYSSAARQIVAGLRQVLQPDADEGTTGALAVLEETASSLAAAAETARRRHARHSGIEDASMMRIRVLLNRARLTWLVLCRPGRAVADGVPMRCAAILVRLEAAIDRWRDWDRWPGSD